MDLIDKNTHVCYIKWKLHQSQPYLEMIRRIDIRTSSFKPENPQDRTAWRHLSWLVARLLTWIEIAVTGIIWTSSIKSTNAYKIPVTKSQGNWIVRSGPTASIWSNHDFVLVRTVHNGSNFFIMVPYNRPTTCPPFLVEVPSLAVLWSLPSLLIFMMFWYNIFVNCWMILGQ